MDSTGVKEGIKLICENCLRPIYTELLEGDTVQLVYFHINGAIDLEHPAVPRNG